MSTWKSRWFAVVLLALVALPARAQIAGHPFEASAGAGINNFDSRDALADSPVFQGSAGWRFSDAVTYEASFLRAATHALVTGPELKHQWSLASADVLWMVRDPAEAVTPYLLAGLGLGRSWDERGKILRAGSPSIGLGLRYNIKGNPHAYLRLQARDAFFHERDAANWSQHIALTASLSWVFRGRAKDQDLDGVRNWLDKCPNTPIGAKVDRNGCPIDSDHDGVFDGLDKCPGTTAGCRVDKNGCPTDADGDGVCDGLDQCADTPRGATVDAKGCPIDSDGDGVFDGLDKCPNTPKGAVIDTSGCPIDTDGDGVPDGIDQCPNTPRGVKVNEAGCPVEVSPREEQMLDTGTIRLENIQFDTNKATIKVESDSLLDEVGRILLQYPSLTVEIGGHTDNSGKAARNDSLSDARAKAVKGYLTGRFPTLDASHFSVKGYGASVPVAPNTTKAGRAKNRRVEFKVTNIDQLRQERSKRLPPAPATGAPPDSTKH
jgi:OOP family OmpA-OmpF porin